MLRGPAILTLAAIASAATAQQPPTVRVEPTPPPVQTWHLEFTAWCGPEHPSIEVDKPPTNRVALLRNRLGPLAIAACSDELERAQLIEIESLPAALVFMAYKPFEPFWPEAEARWGSNLGKLRQSLREAALGRTADGYPYAVLRSETAAAINVAHGLTEIGYFDEARARLTVQLDALVDRKARGRRNLDLDFDLALLALVRAATEYHAIDSAAAADFLGEFARTRTLEPDYATNVTINRAAYLVESGRHHEALELLLPEYESFTAGLGEDANSYQIGGSRREFAWILACAYAHAGQPEKARAFAAIITSAEEIPRDQYMPQTKPGTYIKLRMHRCMDDPGGYFETWRNANEFVLSPAWLEFQKAGKPWMSGTPRTWIATRPESAAISTDYRQLPERFLPALSRWQASQ